MDMQWVTELKHHTRELQTQMLAFCRDYPPEETDQSYMESLLANTNQFELWVNTLPDAHQIEVWQWVNWRTAAYDAKVLLSLINGYLDLLLFVYDNDKLISPDLMEQAQNIKQHLDRVLEIYDQSRTAHDAYRWSAESETVTIPGNIVLAALWPMIYPWAVDQTLSLPDLAIQDWPAVHYHPYYTPNLLYAAITMLMRNGLNICVVPHKTDRFFEVHLADPTLLLRPDAWEGLLTRFQEGDSIERLRELGGNLLPLVWDEGQGQGMIIQLPWAKD